MRAIARDGQLMIKHMNKYMFTLVTLKKHSVGVLNPRNEHSQFSSSPCMFRGEHIIV